MYALDTQMGTNYKAELIPQRTRDAIHGWGKEARRRRKRLVIYGDDSTFHTDTSTMLTLEKEELIQGVVNRIITKFQDLNKELTHKLEVQTQRLELLIILLTPMKVAERVLGWIMKDHQSGKLTIYESKRNENLLLKVHM
ncbi:MLO-like protein 11 isoform X1 [Helianthus annuus]|uniref:MLO-like protein 11 isoform X1 n=1 Tax=Helianthus annuus TaxID=4232 RepID=UPI000B8FAD21|nr:MLO-like protein 11 isoform X1 [Helianthus annuus]XP_022002203.1 MLO-like protein 11 isoform X1 [Helianthus annuus]XP_035837502.1 MLO-like protein 11 isoform X1 [Helianthus annuus]XP_035837503.1 MLO-like protein 11 isoform X1 [Helianthus annuus]XP_035837504.1 MLO-like protein 11 isoform X1 [Helianthus annuus]XP_035837505.1 MLO-like protein 11 isoform X1 [Helianthus annuus]